MAGNRFEIVSNGSFNEQTPGFDATLTIVDLDVSASGSTYRIEWREDWVSPAGAATAYYRQEFNLAGTALSDPVRFALLSGTFEDTTDDGRTYLVREDSEGPEAQFFRVFAELGPSGVQGGLNVYTDPLDSSTLDGTSNSEIVNLGGGNDVYFSSDAGSPFNGGADTVFGGAGGDVAHLYNRQSGTNEELLAGHFDGGEGTDDIRLNGDVSDYRVIAHGDTLLFRHQDFQDRSNLGRKIASAENVERLAGVDVATIVEDGFAIRATTPTGSAPTDLSAIRDFDGNDLGAAGSWKLIGAADVQYDNDAEWIYVNPEIGRWASVGPGDDGGVDFADHGQSGETRVVGIYIDPLVEIGVVERFSEFDSQRRFQNDLFIDNLEIIDAFDFDADGFQEVYFRVTDGTAYLRALMHADGNIQYANYQNEQQVEDYLSGLGYGDEVIDAILV